MMKLKKLLDLTSRKKGENTPLTRVYNYLGLCKQAMGTNELFDTIDSFYSNIKK